MQPVVKMVFGSHLYGTNTEKSDHDFKGVFVPAPRDIIMGTVPNVITEKTKADNSVKNTADDIDSEMYSLKKYLQLASEGQTVALDMLFAPREFITYKTTLWTEIQDNKHRLLTSKYMSFMGYCRTQANKYGIKGSRMAAAKVAVDYFSDMVDIFGPQKRLADLWQDIELFVKDANSEHILIVPDTRGDHLLEVCNRKCQRGNTVKAAFDMYAKLYEDYGVRARQAMNNEGVDWKALSHAVRIGQQACELLETGNVVFPRPNANYLLAIKSGMVAYDLVSAIIEDLLDSLEEESKKSTLPPEPDKKWIDDLVYNTYLGSIGGYRP